MACARCRPAQAMGCADRFASLDRHARCEGDRARASRHGPCSLLDGLGSHLPFGRGSPCDRPCSGGQADKLLEQDQGPDAGRLP